MSTCQTGLDDLLNKLVGKNLDLLQDEMEDVGFKVEGLDGQDDFKYKEVFIKNQFHNFFSGNLRNRGRRGRTMIKMMIQKKKMFLQERV